MRTWPIVFLAACHAIPPVPALFEPGADDDPIVTQARALSSAAPTPTNCAVPLMTSEQHLYANDFSVGDALWPNNDGGGEFGGDWNAVDGAARVDVDGIATRPLVTGFFWFFDVCVDRTHAGTVRFSIDIDATEMTSADSNASLVVYQFDAAGNRTGLSFLIAVRAGERRRFIDVETALNDATRRVAIAPMIRVGVGETHSARYDNLTVDFVPWAYRTYALQPVLGFAAPSGSDPPGWVETSGEWVVDQNHVVLWNPTWSGGAITTDEAVLTRVVTIPAGRRMWSGTFFASNFVDPESAAWMTIEVGGTVLGTSQPITGEDFGQFGPPNIALPPGTTELTVRIHAVFGPNETASFYASYVLINIAQQ